MRRHGAPRRRRSWGQRLLVLAGALVTVVALAGAGMAGYVGYRLSQITRYSDVEVQAAPPGEPVNYLIVGSDSRENITEDDPGAGGMLDEPHEGRRSDTIMLLRVDPEARSADLVSFPRDLYLPLAGDHGENRINAAYGLGRQVLVDTIQQNFGIEVNHYVEIDFVAFRDVVDAIGGVPLYFTTPVRDRKTGLNVPVAGCQVLTGQQALDFARSRALQYQDADGDWRSDPTADLGRITRQQVFVRRALTQALSSGLGSPSRLNGLLGAVLPKLGVDEGFEVRDALELARRFEGFDAEGLVSHTLPVVNAREGKMSIVRLVRAPAEPILNVFRGLPPDAIGPGSVEVSVVNGTGVTGQAALVTDALRQIGFDVGEPGTTDERYVRTTVRYGEGGEAGARLVARHVSGGAELVADPGLEPGTVVLVTGADTTTLHALPTPEDPAATTTTTTTTVPEAEGSPPGSAVEPPGPTTTTTVIGYSTGDPPPGVECS